MDDNFSSIVKSVLWGRAIFSNIRKFLQVQYPTFVHRPEVPNSTSACSTTQHTALEYRAARSTAVHRNASVFANIRKFLARAGAEGTCIPPSLPLPPWTARHPPNLTANSAICRALLLLQFQLTINLVALVVAFVAAVTKGETPLTVMQLLWVNLIMDSLAALGEAGVGSAGPAEYCVACWVRLGGSATGYC
jgi:hypothetical protein